MRIILLGAPGVGKGTQANFIFNKYGIPWISTGNILRNAANKQSELGKKISKTINHGKLINDKLIVSLIKERIQQKDCHNGFLLDGFPRTIAQANAIIKANIIVDYVLQLILPDEFIIERIIGRRIHLASGRIYHIKFNPPKKENKDDITGESLTFRDDDQEKAINTRLLEYHSKTVPLIDFYRKEASMGNVNYFEINGNQRIADINNELVTILKINKN